ncbi:MAG: type II secretion system protein [Planctomycetota bacterium]
MRTSSPRGFTLIELLIAMAIMILLASLLIVAVRPIFSNAKRKATAAFLGEIQTALSAYHAVFRDFPPDGYDREPAPPGPNPGWAYGGPTGGLRVGIPPRDMKGTQCLIYFLCRPVINVHWKGSTDDPRNSRSESVGPFLRTVTESHFSVPGFNPNKLWSAWNAQEQRCMMIDNYGRPICYDKVKLNTPVYFQPSRFHRNGGSGPGGEGIAAHADQTYIQSQMWIDEGLEDPSGAMNATTIATWHVDPRFTQAHLATLPELFAPTNYTFPGSLATHEPKVVGTYNLWSAGESWLNPQDDICSWEGE